jgi:hypothetical protein
MYTVITAKDIERYNDLRNGMEQTSGPKFLGEDKMVTKYWPQLAETFPDNQFCMVEKESRRPVAVGNSIPVAFEGSWHDLPAEGLDWVLERVFLYRASGNTPTIMSALYIEVAGSHRGRHLSGQMLATMRQIAQSQGFSQLIAPVRPSMKSHYPLIDINTYLTWQTVEGLPFDPWLRVHVRAGGRVLHPCPRAMSISGTRAEWADWTGMALPGDGDYAIPYGLVPLRVRGNEGKYVEPGVWVLHEIAPDD